MKKTLLHLLILTLSFVSTTSYSTDSLSVVSEFLQNSNPDQQLTKDFIAVTGIEEDLNSLPWSLSNGIYKMVKIGSVGFRLATLSITADLKNAQNLREIAQAASLQMTTIGHAGVNTGPLLAKSTEVIIDNIQNLWEMAELTQEMNEIFKSSPGSRLELLAVDYSTFSNLFMALGALKVIGPKWHQPEQKNNFNIAIQQSIISFAQSARQLAGIKKVTGGQVVALSLEARLALMLMQLPDDLQKLVLNSWDQGVNAIIKKEQSWFGNGRDIFRKEVDQSLSELQILLENPDVKKGIRTGTYSAKVGILTLGLAQVYFKSPEMALNEISQSEKYLEKLGLENSRLASALTPIAYSSTLIQSGLELGVEWTLGPVAYVETLSGHLAGGVASGISSAYEFLSQPGENLGLNWVRENGVTSAAKATELMTSVKLSGMLSNCGALVGSALPSSWRWRKSQ